MAVVAHAGDFNSHFPARLHDIILVHVAVHFGAIESGGLRSLYLFQHSSLHTERSPHNRLLEGSLAATLGSGQRSEPGRRNQPGGASPDCGLQEKLAAFHSKAKILHKGYVCLVVPEGVRVKETPAIRFNLDTRGGWEWHTVPGGWGVG